MPHDFLHPFRVFLNHPGTAVVIVSPSQKAGCLHDMMRAHLKDACAARQARAVRSTHMYKAYAQTELLSGEKLRPRTVFYRRVRSATTAAPGTTNSKRRHRRTRRRNAHVPRRRRPRPTLSTYHSNRQDKESVAAATPSAGSQAGSSRPIDRRRRPRRRGAPERHGEGW